VDPGGKGSQAVAGQPVRQDDGSGLRNHTGGSGDAKLNLVHGRALIGVANLKIFGQGFTHRFAKRGITIADLHPLLG